jgi:hypothetical protein
MKRPKWTAQGYWYEEDDFPITDVVVAKDRISIDWAEEGQTVNVVLSSDDGVVYRGSYRYRGYELQYYAELRLYRDARGELLLMGRWWRVDFGDQGNWLVRLTPANG